MSERQLPKAQANGSPFDDLAVLRFSFGASETRFVPSEVGPVALHIECGPFFLVEVADREDEYRLETPLIRRRDVTGKVVVAAGRPCKEAVDASMAEVEALCMGLVQAFNERLPLVAQPSEPAAFGMTFGNGRWRLEQLSFSRAQLIVLAASSAAWFPSVRELVEELNRPAALPPEAEESSGEPPRRARPPVLAPAERAPLIHPPAGTIPLVGCLSVPLLRVEPLEGLVLSPPELRVGARPELHGIAEDIIRAVTKSTADYLRQRGVNVAAQDRSDRNDRTPNQP